MDVPLEVDVRDGRESVLVSLSGELDICSSPKLQAVFDEVNLDKHRKLELDMEKVTFLDSEAIKTLVNGCKNLSGKGVDMSITACSRYVARVLRLAGVEKLVRLNVTDENWL